MGRIRERRQPSDTGLVPRVTLASAKLARGQSSEVVLGKAGVSTPRTGLRPVQGQPLRHMRGCSDDVLVSGTPFLQVASHSGACSGAQTCCNRVHKFTT